MFLIPSCAYKFFFASAPASYHLHLSTTLLHPTSTTNPPNSGGHRSRWLPSSSWLYRAARLVSHGSKYSHRINSFRAALHKPPAHIAPHLPRPHQPPIISLASCTHFFAPQLLAAPIFWGERTARCDRVDSRHRNKAADELCGYLHGKRPIFGRHRSRSSLHFLQPSALFAILPKTM